MRQDLTRILARVSILAAVYAALTILPPFNAAGYLAIQVRVSEGLAVLPYIVPWAPWGLFLGCIFASLGSPFLLWDITVGALTSFAAAKMTSRMPSKALAPLPSVVLNALILPLYIAPLSGMPYITVAFYIGVGQAVACYGIGYPLLVWIDKSPNLKRILKGQD